MNKFIGVEYARGATARIINDGPALAPAAVREMFPNANWTMISPDAVPDDVCMADRFGENLMIQKKVYAATPRTRHIFIGGDHSLNFGHFSAIADAMPDQDVCLVYVDAHLDMHTPESSRAQASGAPHGTNVRHDLGDGDARWLEMPRRVPGLRPENLFYLATRAFEPAEIEFVRANNIFMRTPDEIKTDRALDDAIAEIRRRIDGRPFVLSFDFDAIDPQYFKDVLVPEPNGISMYTARRLVREFSDADSIEFVEYAPRGDIASAQAVETLVRIAAGK